MKAIRFNEYGPAEVLRYELVDDPAPHVGEVLIRVFATSVNPIDWKLRLGSRKSESPIDLPYIPGRDLAGEVLRLGSGVTGLSVGDRVMGLANHTYAELCVAPADDLTGIPLGLSFEEAAALPLVTATGDQLVRQAAKAKPGQTILITGAVGSVGRCAVFAAKEIGCTILAGVRRSQSDQAAALPGVAAVIALDDADAVASMRPVDCVANTISSDTSDVPVQLLAKVREGGVFGTIVHGTFDRLGVETNSILAQPCAETTRHYAEAVEGGRLEVPTARRFPLGAAADAQRLGEKGANGKIILTPER